MKAKHVEDLMRKKFQKQTSKPWQWNSAAQLESDHCKGFPQNFVNPQTVKQET